MHRTHSFKFCTVFNTVNTS